MGCRQCDLLEGGLGVEASWHAPNRVHGFRTYLLSIVKSHSGNFKQGQPGAIYAGFDGGTVLVLCSRWEA